MADTWVISSPNLAKLRSDGQHSRNYLCIPQPATVLKASLSALPTDNDGSVADLPITVISGSTGAVLPDQTVLIMDSAESEVLGICRVRKAAGAGTLYISEDNNDTVRRWVVGEHLLVLDEWGIWPRHLRVVGKKNPTFYADWDVAYSDQHAHPDPVIRFGPPIIPVWKTGSTVAVPFDGSGSAMPYSSDTIASWLWATGAGSIANQTTHSPTVTLSATGRVRVSATATSSAGKAWTRYAHIECYGADRAPITDFELTSDPEGSAGNGGWSFSVKMYGQADITTVRHRALVCLWADDYYQNTLGSIGPVANRAHIIAWGWIAGETIEWDAEGGFVTFDVRGADHFLACCTSFPAGVEDTDFADNGGGAPNRWTEMEDLTTDKALWAFCHERSTVDRACDVFFTGNLWQAAQIPSAAADLWSQLLDFANATLLALPAFDRYGRLIVSRNQHHVPLDERSTIPTVISLTTDDHARVEIQPRPMSRYSQVSISGVYYLNKKAVPVGAYSPGKVPIAPAEDGAYEETELVLGTQAETSEWCGLIGGSGDGPIDTARITIPRNYRHFDIAPQTWVEAPVEADDTVRGVAYTARLIPRSVRLVWDAEAGCWGVELECEGEGVQWGADNMTFPGETEPNPPDPPDPPDPPEPPIEPPIEPPTPSDADAVVATGTNVHICANLDESTPTWASVWDPAPTAATIRDASLCELDNDKYIVLTEDDGIWLTTDLTGAHAWTQVWLASIPGATDPKFYRILWAPGSDTLVYVVASGVVGSTRYVYIGRSATGGTTWTWTQAEETVESGAIELYEVMLEGEFGGTGTIEMVGDNIIEFEIIFDTSGNFPVCNIECKFVLDPLPPYSDDYQAFSYDCIGDLPSAGYDTDGDLVPVPEAPIGTGRTVQSVVVTPIDGGFHVEGEIRFSEANFGDRDPEGYIRFGYPLDRDARWDGPCSDVHRKFQVRNLTIGGQEFEGSPTYGFDVARTNNDWLYVGMGAKILQSEDGGFSFSVLTEDHGAQSICVDPQAAGAVYFIHDGEVYLIVAGVIQGAALGTGLANGPIGLAHDMNSGRLYGFPSSVLAVRNLGSWVDSDDTTNFNPMALHAYLGGKIIFLELLKVKYSGDYGVTVDIKNGSWTYGGGRSAHLMKAD